MAIPRDPPMEYVRAFLSDPGPAHPAAPVDAAALWALTGVEVLFSRGIPDAETWRR